MPDIPSDVLQREIGRGYKPVAFHSELAHLPLTDIGDRQFELLCYSLLKLEIEKNRYPEYDAVTLMPGVGERGRDCCIYKTGNAVGIIQCKNYKQRISRPMTVKEILKFLLHCIIDPSLMPGEGPFDYHLYVAGDFAGTTITLLDSFQEEIVKDPLEEYCKIVIDDYESFKDLKVHDVMDDVRTLLARLRVCKSAVTDISTRVMLSDELMRTFFTVRCVTSVEETRDVVRELLEEYGMKGLTDEDLKVLQKQIGDLPADYRADFGILSIFGYPLSFLRAQPHDVLNNVIMTCTQVRMTLDTRYMDFIVAEIDKLIIEEITIPLVKTQGVCPFSVQAVAPLLFHKYLRAPEAKKWPPEMAAKMYPDIGKSDVEVLESLLDRLLKTTEKVLQNDFSDCWYPPELAASKIGVLKYCHAGLRSMEHAKEVFWKDIKTMEPALKKIDDVLRPLLKKEVSILMKGEEFLKDESRLRHAIDSMLRIEKEPNSAPPPSGVK